MRVTIYEEGRDNIQKLNNTRQVYRPPTKPVNGFPGYSISREGFVYNKKGERLSPVFFKNTQYVRLYKNGKRYSRSLYNLIKEHYIEPYMDIPLYDDELMFQYETDSNYFITSRCRVYNRKTRKWLNVFYKKGIPTVNLSVNGRARAVSIIKFLRSKGGLTETDLKRRHSFNYR